MLSVFKILTYKRGDKLVKKGDEIDFYGIILSG
jgi:hypothetical protein